MKRFPTRLALGLIAGLIVQTAGAAPAAPAATVNGVAISSSLVDVMANEQHAQGAPDNPKLRDAIREELIRRELLVQEAAKQGIEKRPDVKAQIDLARQAVVIRTYIQDYMKAHPVTDADVKAEYDRIKGEMGEKEYKPRHILVETEDEAKAIIAKLRAGEKFEDLAKESKDPGSKDKGGELGWSNPGMFVQPFSEAMVKLGKGEYTTVPVKSDFGWHVIQLEDVRDLKAPPLEQVKQQLEQRLQQQKIEKHLEDLRAKAKIQ